MTENSVFSLPPSFLHLCESSGGHRRQTKAIPGLDTPEEVLPGALTTGFMPARADGSRKGHAQSGHQ